MTAPLGRRLAAAKWGKFKLGKLFKAQVGDVDLQQKDCHGKGEYLINSGIENCGIKGRTDRLARIFPPNTITVDFWGNAFYRNFNYKLATHNHVFSLSGEVIKNERIGLFLVAQLSFLRKLFSFDHMGTWNKIKTQTIVLPVTTDGEIDFKFMESFIRELEEARMSELAVYLSTSDLDNCKLSTGERSALGGFGKLKWREYNVKKLFGPSTRGKRLKSDDRISGTLPFITAGEAETGVSAFIGNKVKVFGRNTTTIDMFGSAKYRNYEYGADDHVAVVHTEKLPKHAAVFVAAACHKAAHTGAFDYGRNFYAKDADALSIMLPAHANGSPDWTAMELFMRAVQKLVIRDVVAWKDREIAATRQVVSGEGDRPRPPRRTGMEILPEVPPKLRFREYLPLYSLKAACGKFGDGEAVEPLGWVKADIGRKLDGKMFVVKAVGRSMEPKIRDGDLCVMRAWDATTGGTPDKPVLVQHRDATDPETGGAYSIKNYSSEKTARGDRRHKRIILAPQNPEFPPMVFGPDTPEEALKAVANFVAVLASPARERRQ